MSTYDYQQAWWHAPKREVHKRVFDQVRTVERNQWDIYDRFVKLEWLYDPCHSNADRLAEILGLVTENAVAQCVDAATAATATVDTRSVFDTDDADWSVQRQCKKLGWYVEQLAKDLDRQVKCHDAQKSGTKKGTGCIHGFIDQFDRMRLEYVMPDDIIVNERECRSGGAPRQIHRRSIIDREELMAEYPGHVDQIGTAQQTGSWQKWADYRPLEPNEIVKLESYRLPIGVKGMKGYVAGRHTICIDGLDLLDEPFEDEDFPIKKVVWEKRDGSWYGISLTERISGHQRAINKMNWQVDKQLDQLAMPVKYVRPSDVDATVKTNKAGMWVVIRGEYPKDVVPPAVSGEVYNRIEKLGRSAKEISGLSDMALHGAVPAGLESGVAIREAKGATTDRFAPQEKAYERLNLEVDLLILILAKKLGKKAPAIYRKTRFGSRKITWSQVDMKDLKVQISAAGTLARTHAGRIQFVMDLAQTGVISTPTMLKLVDHPDLESELSLYTAAMDVVDGDLEEIAEGRVVMPEPQGNLKLVEVRAQETYNKWSKEGAPEDVLEGVRQYMNQAIALQQPPPMPQPMPGAMMPANDNAMPMDGAAPDADAGVGQLAAPPMVAPQLKAV